MSTDRQGLPDPSPDDPVVSDMVWTLPGWLEIYPAQWRPGRARQYGPTSVGQMVLSLVVIEGFDRARDVKPQLAELQGAGSVW